MNKIVRNLLCSLIVVAAVMGIAAAQQPSLTIQVDKPGHKISPMLYGIFFEEINCSGDGGLYPELVRNRSFEDSDKPESWAAWPQVDSAALSVEIANPSTSSEFNTHSLKVEIKSANSGVVNDGWWGMNVEKGAKYNLTLYARSQTNSNLWVSLIGSDGKVTTSTKIDGITSGWKKFTAVLTANGTDPKARLTITSSAPGTLWLDYISLLPAKTWKNHGLRPDLAEMLNGLKPSFVRFPGGCWVEGRNMDEAMRWKTTIGSAIDRRTQFNIWGYQSTNSLGYYEYLQLCEDLGAEPLFVINIGMSHGGVTPMDQMNEKVQDALDAIEYANGPVTSKWGKMRAEAGHPKPFGLKYMEIGNENGGPAYNERWPLFVKAIKAKYPEMTLISDVPVGGPEETASKFIDEHYYSSPDWFVDQANKYDSYDRKGPKIYVGEYAVTSGTGLGNVRGAVGEAAFMVGMERNSDVVRMASYAPLFINLNHRAWPVNLIDFDSSKVYGIPSYYVQQMFSQNRGDVVLPVDVQSSKKVSEPTHGAIGFGTWVTESEYKDIEVRQGDKVLFKSDFSKGLEGWNKVRGQWEIKDGALRQTTRDDNTRIVVGDPSWTEYTLTCKARKVSGNEGFLILFRVQDEEKYAMWNIGGWLNKEDALNWAGGEIGRHKPGSVETNRWYDIKVEVGKDRVKCYLDGQMIYDEAYPTRKPLHSTASLDTNGDVIVKVVNAAWEPQIVDVNLQGLKKAASKAEAIVLASEKSTDENSLDNPLKVSPKTKSFDIKGPQFKYEFPGNSVTILRIKQAK